MNIFNKNIGETKILRDGERKLVKIKKKIKLVVN